MTSPDRLSHALRFLDKLGAVWVAVLLLYLVSGLALAQRPGLEHESATALGRALTAKHELGDIVGTAYAVEAHAWLAARREQYERTAWLIGAADQPPG